MSTDKLALLRKPFEPNQISLLPKPYKKDSPKGKCDECGGYHGLPAVHLKYVGHAALTDRLLDVDPTWSWEPLALDADGLPKYDKSGGLWIKLTICGITRLGYGNTDSTADNGNAEKEIIGDALRNAAMRFGAALDLWHKGDLHGVDDEGEKKKPVQNSPAPKPQPKTSFSPNAVFDAIKNDQNISKDLKNTFSGKPQSKPLNKVPETTMPELDDSFNFGEN